MRRLRISSPVRLYVSSIARVPTVIGWLRPCILLPVSPITGLSEAQLRAVLAHELAHIRRHDYLVNLLQNAVETLLFYHPAVWWVSRRIREERENCCDDLAVAVCEDVVMYAGALAQLEQLRANISQPALAATGGNLLSRIRRLMGVSKAHDRIPKSLGSAMAAALVVIALIVSSNVNALRAQLGFPPKFEIADIHRTVREIYRWTDRMPPSEILRGGRYELRRTTMLDLIRIAYAIEPDKVLGGPGWLGLDRFDIIAKAPSSTPPETLRLMLQALLADRFKLAVHKETKLLPAFVMSLRKGSQKFTRGDDLVDGQCQPSGNGMVSCRDMTMAGFGQWLNKTAPAYVTHPVVDFTGLKGAWNFDFKWDSKTAAIFDVLDSQLGLSLEPQTEAVLVVDHVNETPTDNPPGVAQILPPRLTEFEEAAIRPSNPEESASLAPYGESSFDPSTGIRETRGATMGNLIASAWDIPWGPSDKIFASAPKWIDSARFDIVVKEPAGQISGYGDDFRPMLRALLIKHFRMSAHYEDRRIPAYRLVAANPKLKRADPSNRTACKITRRTSPYSTLLTCLNMTMAQFAEQLRDVAGDYTHGDILDATGIDGAWDFALYFGPKTLMDPSDALLFDALTDQLGLKLEPRQATMPMLVIDHIEEKPTEN